MPSMARYPRCPKCDRRVPQIFDKVVKGKRVELCSRCADKAGWFSEDAEPEQDQLQLFNDKE